MRKHPKHSRVGPGLIEVMARSAVLVGSAEIEPALMTAPRRRRRATSAAAHYDQLLELMAAGILTSDEVSDAVERLTARASLAPVRRGRSGHRRRGTDEAPSGARPH